MNVSRLIELLKTCPDDMEVKFVYNYGDYWRTEVAAEVSHLTTGDVTYSEYHRMDKVVDETDDTDDLDEDEREELMSKNRTVVLLSTR